MFRRQDLFFPDEPFRHHDALFDQMNQMNQRMMSGFGHPFMMNTPMLNGSHHGDASRRDIMMPHSMFAANSMFGNMGGFMSDMRNDPNMQSFSSSQVLSYSSNGNGPPKYYEAKSEVTQGPDGVKQTRKSERNSETGIDRMAVGHHIYDRGHVVERSLNRRSGDREEKQDYINMEENAKDEFHKEWQQKARVNPSRHALYNPSRNRHEARAIDDREHGHRSRGRYGKTGRHGNSLEEV